MINQTVIVGLNAEALLSKRFNLKEEVASALEWGEDNYAALIEALKDEGMTDVINYLDEHLIPQAYVDIDYEHVKFHAQDAVVNNALDFLVPFSFNAAKLDLDIKEGTVIAEDKND